MRDEYSSLEGYVPRQPPGGNARPGSAAAAASTQEPTLDSKSASAKLIDSIKATGLSKNSSRGGNAGGQLVLHSSVGGAPVSGRVTAAGKAALTGTIMIPTASGGEKEYTPSASLAKRIPSKWPRPTWHAPWRTYRVISGHLGWVRSIAFDPGNEWFVTGSGDRTIKVWDVASGQLRLTLTGHIEQVTGLAISERSPYMFSCGLDKMVKCWDLEQNKVIRNYHGHLSGVYSIALHPTLDILATGGRDATCRIWDIRTKVQVFALGGHDDTVAAILTQGTDPQIITGSHDKTIKLWDLRMGKTLSTLTYHKKSVRALAMHPTEHTFASGAADNIKKFRLPEGEFLHNMLQQQRAIINAMAINEDGVMATGGDNGSMYFWDWKSGNAFQQGETIAQPGSLDSESGIYAMAFDRSGTRLVTCEADKSIKMWKEDENATPESHPIDFRPPKDIRRW
jgi:pleiotropic regulator 1